jgi:hypothetical protein
VREELVQRRVEQADGHRQAVHRLEDALEVLPLDGQQLLERPRRLSRFSARIISRMAMMRSPEEHVLGPAEADALGAELAGPLGVGGVSALVRTPSVRYLSAQLHDGAEVAR